jgi:hypothetical protein
MYTEHQYQIGVGLSNGHITFATRRHLAAVSASVRFNDYENRELLENGGSWTRNVYRTPIANQVGLSNGQVTSATRRHLAAVSASGLLQKLRKSRITRERWQLDEKCLKNTNSKSGLAYRMVKLLQLGGATCC